MLERIEISVIPQDLRHEETIVQISEALDDLDFAVNHIFDSINKRISENNKRLEDIQSRASKLQDQLNYLKTDLNMKAVKMFSAAKYPAMNTYNEYKLTIQPKIRREFLKSTIYKSSVPISDKIDSRESSSHKGDIGQQAANLQEKLQFYYVKAKPKIGDTHQPKRITSIDLLLPLESKDTQQPVNVSLNENTKQDKLADAPNSIIQPWISPDMESPSDYLYAPTLGEVPEINVPLSLPDLPGIVDNERFISDLNSQNPIAPSSTVTTPILQPAKPSFPLQQSKTEVAQSKDTIDHTAKKIETEPIQNTVPKETKSNIVDPDPDKVPEKAPLDTKKNESDTNILTTSPPPPPPPPPPGPVKDSNEPDKPLVKPTSIKPNISDDRSNLMAAIRDAGGIGRAKLRQTAAADKSKDRWSSASVGGDLMADLHSALSLRRKGIAGSAINALARMSSMIPPPPKPTDVSSDRNSATSECESQGDDDWE